MIVGAADDTAEREADRFAEQLVGGSPGKAPSTDNPGAHEVDPIAASGESFAAPSDVASRISARRGGGSPLPSDLAHRFESRLGTDLSSVRVHTDSEASEMSHQLSAQAFTTGNDIYVANRSYRPHTGEGERLLAHEVGHTLQNSDDARRNAIRRKELEVGLTHTTHPRKLGPHPTTKSKKWISVVRSEVLRPGDEEHPNTVTVDDKQAIKKSRTRTAYVKLVRYNAHDTKGKPYSKNARSDWYVRLAGLNLEAEEEELEGDELGESIEGVFSAPTEATSDAVNVDKQQEKIDDAYAHDDDHEAKIHEGDKAKFEMEGAPVELFGSIEGEVADLFAFGGALVKLQGWKELKKTERADAIVGLISSLGGYLSKGATLAKTGLLAGGTDVSETSAPGVESTIGEVTGGFFADFKALWTSFKSWWDAIKSVRKGGGKETIGKKFGGAIRDTASLGKSIMESAKTLLEAIHHGVGHLSQAIPGISIAISGLKVIMRGWDFVRSLGSRKSVRADKRLFKVLAGGTIGSHMSRSTRPPRPDAFSATQRVAAWSFLHGKELSHLSSETRDWLTSYATEEGGGERSTLGELAADVDPRLSESNQTNDDKVHESFWNAYKDQKFVQVNATKEATRAGIEIGQEVVNIAGEIAHLTGVGAAVGAGLKAGSAVWKGLTSGFRWLKQLYHNRKGDSKSAKAKSERYAEDAKRLLLRVESMTEKKNPRQAKFVLKELKSRRISVGELKRAGDRGLKAAFDVIITASKRR